MAINTSQEVKLSFELSDATTQDVIFDIPLIQGDSAFTVWAAEQTAKEDGSDYTVEEYLAAIKGAKGDKGNNGVDGLSAFEVWKAAQPKKEEGQPDYTVDDYIKDITGPKGDKGDKGEKGDGIHLKGTVDTLADLPADKNTLGDIWAITDTVEVALWNGTEWKTAPLNALKGDKGDKGDTGEKGATGEAGKNGKDGDSAFAVWVAAQAPKEEGEYTEAEYFAAITGPQGKTGADGKDGAQGVGIKKVTVETTVKPGE